MFAYGRGGMIELLNLLVRYVLQPWAGVLLLSVARIGICHISMEA